MAEDTKTPEQELAEVKRRASDLSGEVTRLGRALNEAQTELADLRNVRGELDAANQVIDELGKRIAASDAEATKAAKKIEEANRAIDLAKTATSALTELSNF